MSLTEEKVVMVYGDSHNICKSLVFSKTHTESQEYQYSFDYNVEVMIDDGKYLLSAIRPGYGKEAKLIINSLDYLFIDRYYSYSEKYIVCSKELRDCEILILRCIHSGKVVEKISFKQPVITAHIFSSDFLVVLLNNEGKVIVEIISIEEGNKKSLF